MAYIIVMGLICGVAVTTVDGWRNGEQLIGSALGLTAGVLGAAYTARLWPVTLHGAAGWAIVAVGGCLVSMVTLIIYRQYRQWSNDGKRGNK
ncbi:hypothetical protein [Schleiferilactobacillus shenzhenensis]|uniref:Uncharacterized protein n=1 Tax=Schleiferilactobacillus shenzhenensis LY-73 TaxID=1231336 RepID=U4TNS0_9LACO|nr:hypothetical protein [Schleiferilactobacillus shenzhenensis]ERL65090.1 hypothetical protein L248_3028 [Schleiferilactobacillus shenzhenensis LY-73]